MTFVQSINLVLRRLRETEIVTSTDSSYSKLIAEIVNDQIQLIQNTWEWNALFEEITLTMDGSDEYDITGSTEYTRVIAVYDDTNDRELIRVDREFMNRQRHFTTTAGDVQWYRETGTSALGLRQIDFYPTPASGDSIIVSCYNPQDRITTDSDVIKVPSNVVVLGAYMRAVEERGEDGGGSTNSLAQQYGRYLQDAIILDSDRRAGYTLDWTPE